MPIPTAYILFYLLVLVMTSIDCRAFGQRVEYQYEFDPKRDIHPRVHVKFDDVTDETELMRIFNHRKSSEVRKSPSRYEHTPSTSPFFEDNDRFMVPFEEMDRGNRDAGWRNVPFAENRQWHREFLNLPIHKFVQPDSQDDLAEQMASFLRRQSESILSRHFPTVPLHHFSDPPEFMITPMPKFAF
ncbi:Protein CBG09335 [Caenorhabditis briggsae]|uniref:Protein CBG09335 n=2 Tax=Caenorhabditis briggsae TaxID=6238 RepID=A8X9C2_CAEBR|nr:Protein CBG09335 [Caenorhabditis briggsae]CAP29234.1 Protein CBG09335 [Caenorhabditis briggsae]